MEFLELSIMILIAYLIWKKPEKEGLAFKLFVGVFVVIVVVFYGIDIQYFVLPPMNL
jgi:hypothetical protein